MLHTDIRQWKSNFYNHLTSFTFCSKTFLSLWITCYSEIRGILCQTIPDIITSSLSPYRKEYYDKLFFSLIFIKGIESLRGEKTLTLHFGIYNVFRKESCFAAMFIYSADKREEKYVI